MAGDSTDSDSSEDGFTAVRVPDPNQYETAWSSTGMVAHVNGSGDPYGAGPSISRLEPRFQSPIFWPRCFQHVWSKKYKFCER